MGVFNINSTPTVKAESVTPAAPRMTDDAAHSAAEKRLSELQSELQSLDTEGAKLDAGLAGRLALSSKDRDLAELLGQPDGDAGGVAEKAARREIIRARAAL